MELNREHFRAIIFYNFRRGLVQQQCIDELNSIFGNEAPSRTSVYRWYGEFKTNFVKVVQNQLLFRKPLMLCAKLILEDCHVTYREIETTLGITVTSIRSILHEHLNVKKNLFALDPTQFVNRGASKCVYDIVTGDESWIYAYEPESKQQSTVRVFQDKSNDLLLD